MELTGKCKIEFFKQWDISEEKFLECFSDREKRDLLIEFFDSLGIFILSDNLTNCIDGTKKGHPNMWQCFVKETYKNKKRVGLWFDNRNSAVYNGIKKANDIFNSRK